MGKTIRLLLAKLQTCSVYLPWMTDGLLKLDSQYNAMCKAFEGLRDELKSIVEGKPNE